MAEGLDGGGVGVGGEDVQAFGGVGALAHGRGLGGVFLAVGAVAGVHAHDAGEAAGGVVVVAAAGGEEGVGGAGGGNLQGHEGFEGGEGFFRVGRGCGGSVCF